MLSLSDLKANETCRIVGYCCERSYRRQLLSLGLTPGTEVTMVRCAPLGDPVEFQLLEFNLCLRKDEAKHVWVERVASCKV